MTQPTLPTRFAEAAPRLGIRLYGAIPHAIRTQDFAGSNAESALPAVVPVAGEVLAGVVLDFDDGVMPISEQVSHDMWGVGVPEMLEAARANNRGRESDGVTVIGEGAYLITDEQLGASALLDPSTVAGMAVQGRQVFVAPGSGVVIVAGSDDVASLRVAAELADRVAQQGEGLVSPVPLVAGDDGLEVFEWPSDAELQRLVGRVARVFRSAWYRQQSVLFKESKAFVAKADVFEKDGRAVLVATWTRGVETLLPVVDDVLIVGDAGVEGAVPFQEFVTRAQARQMGVQPERYRVAASARP